MNSCSFRERFVGLVGWLWSADLIRSELRVSSALNEDKMKLCVLYGVLSAVRFGEDPLQPFQLFLQDVLRDTL